MGLSDRYSERKLTGDDFTQVAVLGLDARTLKKGPRHFVTLITGRIETATVIVGVLSDRQQAPVKAFLGGIPPRVRPTIHTGCADMYEGFVNAAQEGLGKRVKLVLDRFPVAQRARSGGERLRQQEVKRLTQMVLAEDYGQLQGAMWALRKAAEKLPEEARDVLVRLFASSPCLKTAEELRGE